MSERKCRRAALWLLVGLMTGWFGKPAQAQTETRRIQADCPPYRIEWNGTSGTFLRRAFNAEPEQRLPLVYLHTDPGPRGHARYLAWFLARGEREFALLWCYLNDTGSEFWCWLYRYPENQLTTQRFVGEYQFAPPKAPLPAVAPTAMRLPPAPVYRGPDFTYRNWTRRVGMLDRLELRQAPSESAEAEPPFGNRAANAPRLRMLNGLRVVPLHELRVGPGNGWRAEGWRELHALALDAQREPYYLILYSNSNFGFVVDLARGQNYVADFESPVRFAGEASAFGESGGGNEPSLETRVRRFERHEVTLLSNHTYANPYTNVVLEVDVRAPNGERRRLLGFWDGTNVWRFRIAPTVVGTWTWRTRSNDPELNAQQGFFECVAEDASEQGFLRIHPSSASRRHFARSSGAPFLPVAVYANVHCLVPQKLPIGRPGSVETAARRGAESSAKLVAYPGAPAVQENAKPADSSETAAFQAFQKYVDELAALGINRFIGGYLLEKDLFVQKRQQNEGGAPFEDYDLDHLNPAYFRWMDRRVAYCNTRGIIPDLGIGWPAEGLFTTYSEAQIRRLWRYVLARYAAYNVCWNLFGQAAPPTPTDAFDLVPAFAEMTRLYDPYPHLLSTMTADPLITVSGPGSISPDSADPGPASPELGRERVQSRMQNPSIRRRRPPPPPPEIAFARETWLDVLLRAETSPENLAYYGRYNKPVELYHAPAEEAAPLSPEQARRWVWETRMRGGYPVGGLSEKELPWTVDIGRFFQRTRFWRLEPHPEMIGGLEDSRSRRRRERAEAAAGLRADSADPSRKNTPQPPPTASPAYVLADPAWEYVVYFPQGGNLTLDLIEATGRLRVTWFNPRSGQFHEETPLTGGSYVTFTAPDANDWALYVSRR